MGRINKTRIDLKKFDEYIKALGKSYSVRVGIIGKVAREIHEGTDLTNAELGAAHEFGATINHPGGQPYYINSTTGMAVFVSKKSRFGQYLISKGQVTKPHTITLPARSFLRSVIFNPKVKKEIVNAAAEAISDKIKPKDLEINTIREVLKDASTMIGETALLNIQKAFYGDAIKPPTKSSSKRNRQYNPANPTLIDTGQLLRSITYDFKEI